MAQLNLSLFKNILIKCTKLLIINIINKRAQYF